MRQAPVPIRISSDSGECANRPRHEHVSRQLSQRARAHPACALAIRDRPARDSVRHRFQFCYEENSHPGDRRHVRQEVRRADRAPVLSRHARAGDAAPRALPTGRDDRNRHDDRQPRSGRCRTRGRSWNGRARAPRPRSWSRTAPTRWCRRRARWPRPSLASKTIVLTGAMVPYAFGSSDGLFNLGSRSRSSRCCRPACTLR